MQRIETILFDLDGTLIDSIRLILDSYHHTMAAHGFAPRSDADWLRGLGTPLRQQFKEWIDEPDTLERMVATYRAYNLANHDQMVRPYPGIAELLGVIRRNGRRTGVVTSKNREGTLRGLRRVGLEDAFEVLVCVDDVQSPKPDREPVDRAVALLDADPSSTMYVGDSIHDLYAGRGAGVLTAAALWGPFSREDLEPGEPDHWLMQPEDVLTVAGLTAGQ
jgi:pyrophosphatase PpaX